MQHRKNRKIKKFHEDPVEGKEVPYCVDESSTHITVVAASPSSVERPGGLGASCHPLALVRVALIHR